MTTTGCITTGNSLGGSYFPNDYQTPVFYNLQYTVPVDTTAKALERAKKLIELGLIDKDMSISEFIELLEALK